VPNGHITPDTVGLLDYTANRTTGGLIDGNQLLANTVLGIGAQVGFATPDQTGLADFTVIRSIPGQLPLIFERLPNLNRRIKWV
jgi:hypothetical protein